MTYRIPTPHETADITAAGLPTGHNIRYFIEPNPTSPHWKRVDYELEWVRREENLIRGSYWSDSGPEYSEDKVVEFEEGTLDGLAERLDALLEDDSERFEDSSIEVTISAYALAAYLDLGAIAA
ncbi:hypothetical protein [Rhodococcoides fascians]|uniref:hypothetical protein n=1 Tax=Rhodococcoides fascians TaxID=1828 RepID=UPI0005626A13|nr:hypothetical protein [Rhodococcus fascians]